MLDNYSWANGIVLSGQKIIDRGEIVSQETYNILESLRKESIKRSESIGQKRLMLAGQVLFVSIFMLCFMLYLDLFRKDYYKRKGSLSLLFALIMFYCVVTAIMVANNIFNVYIIPYAMLPVIIRVFLDSRTAFIAQVTTILICSICLRYPHEFILLQLSAGLVAIFSLRELSQRSQLFRTAFLVILTYAAVYFAFELITENDLTKINGSMYTYFVINGVLLLFTYPLLFLVEKTFGFTSNVTLVELSNINNSLLRRMSETVPAPSSIPCRLPTLRRKRPTVSEPKASWYVPERCIMTSARWRIRCSSPRTSRVESIRTRIWAMSKVPKSSSAM